MALPRVARKALGVVFTHVLHRCRFYVREDTQCIGGE